MDIRAHDVTFAEAMAIAYGVALILEYNPDVHTIGVHTDNMGCVDALRGEIRKGHPADIPLKFVQEIMEGKQLHVKHVKAHTGAKDRDSRLNHQVDRMSKVTYSRPLTLGARRH